jgi:hypothetical protein
MQSEALRNLGIVQRKMKLLAAIEPALLILALPSMVSAEVKPNSLFADNAVFQRGKELPIWGTARERERLTLSSPDKASRR